VECTTKSRPSKADSPFVPKQNMANGPWLAISLLRLSIVTIWPRSGPESVTVSLSNVDGDVKSDSSQGQSSENVEPKDDPADMIALVNHCNPRRETGLSIY